MEALYVVVRHSDPASQLPVVFNDRNKAVTYADYWRAETGAEYYVLRASDRRD